MPRLDRDPEELKARCQRRWGPRLQWQCVYCGAKPARQVDHLFPYWATHDSRPRNLVPVCKVCNNAKNGHQPEEWMRAVGVPESTITMLLGQFAEPYWRRPYGLEFPVTYLNYAAGDLLKDFPGQVRAG